MTTTATATIIASNTALATASQEVASTEVASVPPLLPGEEIYDITSAVTMPYPWLNDIVCGGIVLIVLLAIYFFYRWLTAPVERIRKEIKQSAETQAHRAIKRLQLSDVWQRNDIKAICENVAAILKNYAQDKHNIGIGAAATSDEFINYLLDGKVRNEIMSDVRDMLGFCDEIRYMALENTQFTSESLVETLTKLIDAGGWTK